ncbi:MAG: hypothetical protein KF824_13240 [Fimbriimonadaceae bacterium]|nr:MAG: hypothetical protein KF824_13240 [Fimbriimonadaceae bacterium]
MLLTTLLASMLLSPKTTADWQVETSWVENVTGSHTHNGSPVTFVDPLYSSVGKSLIVTDAIGVATSHGDLTPNESKLSNYDAKFKIRYIGAGSPPAARSFGATVDVYQVGRAASFIFGVSQLPQGFCSVANIGWGSYGYNVLHSYGIGVYDEYIDQNTSYPIHHNSSNPDYAYVSGTAGTAIYGSDASGPYWILTIAGGFDQDIDITSHAGIEGIQGNSEIGTKFVVSSFNNSPID